MNGVSPALFNICTDDHHEGVESTLTQSGDNNQLGGVVDLLEGRKMLQKSLDRLG